MGITKFILNNRQLIDCITSVITAIGTVGAVITSLWFSRKDGKPCLKLYASQYHDLDDQNSKKHGKIGVNIINTGKVPIIIKSVGFSVTEGLKFFDKPEDLVKPCNIDGDEMVYNRKLSYGESIFLLLNENYTEYLDAKLPKGKHLAKLYIRLFWRLECSTSLNRFSGPITKELLDALVENRN